MPSHPDWDDLDDFLQSEDFASPAVVTLKNGTVLTVMGILENPYQAARLGGFEQDSVRPQFHCKYQDVLLVRRGDTFVIEGKTYDAHKGAEPDGTGMACIDLEPGM